ncbi:MAG: hypothetical protein EXS00_03635 [Phycisphaerales bacterium]|nr:hypothetical protein [Phycisphaerales bacterium]
MPLEIERVWLLSAPPSIPTGAQKWTILQGYLRDGRLRRVEYSDGPTRFFHTIKRGAGVVREEFERELDAEEWSAAWPGTERFRITKIRWRVKDGEFVWEIDLFQSLPLALAEVELESPLDDPPVPAWLAPWIVREVTDDPRFRNSALARHGVPQ